MKKSSCDAWRSEPLGYILKDAPLPQLVYAIGMVTKGFESISIPGVTRNVNEYLQQARPHQSSYDRLSLREREVLKLVAEGLSVKEIAVRLNVGAKTVDTHKYNLMTKLDIHNAAGLIRYAIQNKVVSTLPALGSPPEKSARSPLSHSSVRSIKKASDVRLDIGAFFFGSGCLLKRQCQWLAVCSEQVQCR